VKTAFFECLYFKVQQRSKNGNYLSKKFFFLLILSEFWLFYLLFVSFSDQNMIRFQNFIQFYSFLRLKSLEITSFQCLNISSV
jgi:hypothetical protein